MCYVLEATRIEHRPDKRCKTGHRSSIYKVTRKYKQLKSVNDMMIKFAMQGYHVVVMDERCYKS